MNRQDRRSAERYSALSLSVVGYFCYTQETHWLALRYGAAPWSPSHFSVTAVVLWIILPVATGLCAAATVVRVENALIERELRHRIARLSYFREAGLRRPIF